MTTEGELRDLDLEADLAAFLSEGFGDVVSIDDPPNIEDADGADRLLRRIGVMNRRKAELESFAANQRAQLAEWLDDRTAGIDGQIEWATRGIEQWMRSQNTLDERIKTVKLPHGETRIRPAQPRMVVDDVEELAAWLEANEHAELVKREPKVNASDVKAIADVGPDAAGAPDSDGYLPHRALLGDEVIPGVHYLVNPRKSFSFTPR